LILWLVAVLMAQFVGYAGLGLLAFGILLAMPSAGRLWWNYVRRARWLLLSLWLIIAYNTPGEVFQNVAWAPTYEGMAEANLQAVRLIVMLACLAWLFGRLGRDGLVSALWGLLQPVQALGDSRRLVVRLSLVLANLQSPPEKGAWRKMLATEGPMSEGPDTLHLSLPLWASADTLRVVLALAVLLGAILL
jgi:hypothetical protein